MSAAELPAWPVKVAVSALGSQFKIEEVIKVAGYEHRRAEAAIARLRLLRDRAAVVVSEYRREFEKGELPDVDELEDALTAIGELPA